MSKVSAPHEDTEWDRAKAQLGAALVNQVIKARFLRNQGQKL